MSFSTHHSESAIVEENHTERVVLNQEGGNMGGTMTFRNCAIAQTTRTHGEFRPRTSGGKNAGCWEVFFFLLLEFFIVGTRSVGFVLKSHVSCAPTK